MKKSLLILLLICAFNYFNYAQNSIIEQLGGIKTTIKMTSADQTILNDSEQYIIQRAVSSKDVEPITGGASAFGYQPYHLEFLSKAALEEGEKKKLKRDYKIQFYGANDQYLFDWYYSYINIRELKENPSGYKFAFSINLRGLPLILFEEITRIDITKI
jgi:hypothetical protein